ncbi:ABC transporter permease [bacterium]|nr:ABC transporter permease [bacterium]
MKIIRFLTLVGGLLLLWELVVDVAGLPHYILPGPMAVARAVYLKFAILLVHGFTTLIEILAGLALGTGLGAFCALTMIVSRPLKQWVLPVLVISQAIPVFALAPILVIWFGYGMASKIAMAVLIIFFPVTAAFYDGLRRTEPDLLELARVMNARPLATLRLIKIPSALPAFASGLRTATAVAPIGAVVGEWVGASSGLGYFMLHANARMQIDLMFAALFLLSVMSLILYFTIDHLLDRIIYWQKKEENPK